MNLAPAPVPSTTGSLKDHAHAGFARHEYPLSYGRSGSCEASV
jgi:hypothetical protein